MFFSATSFPRSAVQKLGILGWSPASDSEAGGMYFRREGRILEGDGIGGMPLNRGSAVRGLRPSQFVKDRRVV